MANEIIREWYDRNYPREFRVLGAIKDTSPATEIIIEMGLQLYYYACAIQAEPGEEEIAIEAIQSVLQDMVSGGVKIPPVKSNVH